MYKIGTPVLYDKRGVYKIEGVGSPPVRGTSGNYYKLRAVFSNSPVGSPCFPLWQGDGFSRPLP